MSDKITFEEFKKSLPTNISHEQLLMAAKAVGVEVPYREKFYIRKHLPKRSHFNQNPQEIEYVVVPHPLGGRDYWVRKEDFEMVVKGMMEFGQRSGLIK